MTPNELLAQTLLEDDEGIMDRLLAAVNALADVDDATRAVIGASDYRHVVSEILHHLANAALEPKHEQMLLAFARRRAHARLDEEVSAAPLMRLSVLLRGAVQEAVQECQPNTSQAHEAMAIFDTLLNEFEVAFAHVYHSERDAQWQSSQNKYYWLFENASEAILSFRPGDGRIVEANAQTERLLGRSREEVLALSFVDLFSASHRAQAQWLVEYDGSENGLDESSLRLDDVAVLRADKMEVPVSLSCNWMQDEDRRIAQVILRDMTQLRQMQREMELYATQLEMRVGERTRELQQSEDRYRALFLQEQRRAQHLSLINEVQKCALATRDAETFIDQVARAIQSHFRECDVTFLLRAPNGDGVLPGLPTGLDALAGDAIADENEAKIPYSPNEDESSNFDLVVKAQAGGHGFSPARGTRIPAGMGMAGQAMINATPLIQQHDDIDPNIEYVVRSEVCVPLLMEQCALGVLLVQSSRTRGLEARDIVALQTAGAIIATHLEWNRLFQQMNELNSFNHTLITTLLHSLLVVSGEGIVRLVNERACETLRRTRNEMLHRSLADILGDKSMEQHHIADALRDVTRNGTPYEIPEVQIMTAEGLKVFDVRLFRLYFRGEAQAVALFINITRRWRQTQQLQVMNQISHLFQTSLDIDRVLHTVLVCVTAGTALGFNRAFLLLLDAKMKTLTGAQAIGPADAGEASRIWREISRREPTLEELLAQSPGEDSALQGQVKQLQISLDNPCFAPLAELVREQRAARVRRSELFAEENSCDPNEVSEEQRAEREAAFALFTAPDTVIAPLLAKERVVGIVMADNLYSGVPIEPEDVQLLETLAQQAGLTIDNALTYQALQKAQQGLITAERLAVIGEMAARISHEIRNPLTTIGGFARSALKKSEDTAAVERKTRVIVDEVARLEELLNDLLDMATPRPLDLQSHDINAIVRHALLLADADIKAAGVEVELVFGELPPALVDRNRLLQALLNITRNGAQSMKDGGVLTIATRLEQRGEEAPVFLEIEVRDTGAGMSERALKQIFDPFFSTKVSGSGLGLAVTRRIVEDHGGNIEVFSTEGGGTTFVLCLPYRPPPEKHSGSI